jgi:Polyketide cyclase / dehydrase and lipid transport
MGLGSYCVPDRLSVAGVPRMNIWRYQIRESVEIDAPVEQVYTLASNPEVVPVYAPEISRIEIVRRLTEHKVLVKSYLKVAGLTRAFLYLYHYGPPTRYSGVQQDGRFLRGYFTLSFRSSGTGTNVSHTEGILSPIPLVAWIVGFIYFHVMTRGGMREELGRLKSLAETELV